LNLEIIAPRDWEGALLPAWNDLLANASEPSVFLSPEWVGAWWRVYGEGRVPRLLAAWGRDGALVGLAPFYLRRLRLGGLPGPRVLALMGDEAVGSEYLGVLVRPGHGERFISGLVQALGDDWSLADFCGLREGGILAELLEQLFASRNPRRTHREIEPCSLIPLPDDYETYLRSLNPKFRSTLRYRTNKLLKNFSVRLLRTGREEDLSEHLESFFALHQRRWIAQGEPGLFYDTRMRAFYQDVSPAILRRGWLRFYHLEVNGVIRASQFGFVHDGIIHSLQETFDHSFHPPGVGGVGVILRGMAIRESIEEGLKAYDFLAGTEDFKTRWGTTTHHVRRLRIGAPGVVGGLAFCSTAGWRATKDWSRAHLPAWIFRVRDGWRARILARKAGRLVAESEGTKSWPSRLGGLR